MSPPDHSLLALDLPAQAENVAVVRQAMAGLATAFGWSDGVLDDVRMAVSEACTNVVVHAYGGDPGPMQVEARVDGTRLVVDVRDRGRGMGPRRAPDSPGLGLGLSLIAALSDEMRVSESPGFSTEVHMVFMVGRRMPAPSDGP